MGVTADRQPWRPGGVYFILKGVPFHFLVLLFKAKFSIQYFTITPQACIILS